MRSIALFIASAVLAFAQAAFAQDVPSRVGRLAYIQGAVSTYQDPELGWDKAYVNTPITSENSIWTDRAARAEMRVGGISVRLDGETQLDVSRLEEDEFDATLQRGSVNMRVRYRQARDRITFSTPHALFMLDADGRYRVDVDEDRDESRLTVFTGHAVMEGSSRRVPVEAGRTVIVSGRGEYLFERAREIAFDRWAATRDQLWQDSKSRQYVSYDMTGYEELDRYGSWNQDPDYGAVWYPTRIASGWAPYREGHWTYVRPWGWTWVDDAPWGYAPSHYGRWVYVRDRWGWVPGAAVRERPVWAPALVGFIGGASFTVGVSSGSPVGWYPLAPWERYDPWYRAQPAYVQRVNRIVVDRQPRWSQGRGDEWRYWNRERATTVVNREAFVNRRPVQSSVVRVNPETYRQSQNVAGSQLVQGLPQHNELLRYRQQNNTTVAAPTVMRRRPADPQQAPSMQQQQAQQQQAQQQPGQVVRPDFRRRGAPPVAIVPAQGQPQVSAPAPVPQVEQRQQQPQNPAARVERAQQRQAEDAARAQAQQMEAQQREAARAAERNTRDSLQSDKDRAERAAQRQAEEAMRAQAQQGQQRDQQRAMEAQRQQQEQAQRQQQEQAQRQQQEQAQRAARDQQDRAQREAQGREAMAREQQQREAQQRAAREAQQQQEAAQRAAQEQQQRAQQQQRQQQEAAQRAAQEQAQRAQQQQQQAQERAQRERQPQPQQPQQAQPQQAQPQQAQPQQANPAGRGERGERGNRERTREEKEKKDKEDKEKEKDKR
ncbi:MAG TPA: DUF6600 domain-containing protein [Usitatibacter sp.]|nr:DUF6600 domain-containing protein [Usitatibacter sp.]